MKKKKILFILIVILLIIFLLSFLYYYISRKKKEYTSISDFHNIKEIIEYYGCTYIKTNKSAEDGFKKDIYIKFLKPTIDDYGNTNQKFYENVISTVEAKLDNENIRIIDDEKKLIIRIIYDTSNSQILYEINGDSKYFKTILLEYQNKKSQEKAEVKLNIKSKELNTIINAKWIAKNVNLGKVESSIDDYDIYYNKGFEVRNVGNKIYNLIYMKQYKENIFDNITTNMTNEKIENILGNPAFEDNNINLIGYITNQYYVFFYDGEVSIYRIDEEDTQKNTEFANIMTDLNKNGDYKTFLDKLTDIYSDYDYYYKTDNYINIKYSLKGLEIIMGNKNGNGITIYENYKGKITNDINAEEIKKSMKIPVNVNTKIDEDLVFESESERINKDILKRNPNDQIETCKTNKYVVYYDQKEAKFYSRDKTTIDSILSIDNANNIYEYLDNTFIYSIKGKGIYEYNAETMKQTTIVSGNDTFEIKKITDNKLYYDETNININ